MVYYGEVKVKNVNVVYEILRRALLHIPKALPLRGPKRYQEKNFIYSNSPCGKLTHFSGVEIITKNNKIIYQAAYSGGLVDTRTGV